MSFNQIKQIIVFLLLIPFLFSCDETRKKSNVIAATQSIIDTGKQEIISVEDTIVETIKTPFLKDTLLIKTDSSETINTIKLPKTEALALVNYAKTLLNTPYVYGGKNAITGFDNIGFINYVFAHFEIALPTKITNFKTVGKEIPIADASLGDLILFSRSDSVKTSVSYLGIITSEKGMPIAFIFATSGKAKSVTISLLNTYYQKRLIGIRTVFN